MKRRSFLGGMAAGAATAATAAANPFSVGIPRDIIRGEAMKQRSDGSSVTMTVQLVEVVNGRNQIMKDVKPQDIVIRGKVLHPRVGDVFKADDFSFDITRVAEVAGVRVYGGSIAGKPWQKFAWFERAAPVQNGNVLTIRYTIEVEEADLLT